MKAPEVQRQEANPMYRKEAARGIAKVVCYHPRHNITLSQMPLKKVEKVFETFQQEMIHFEKDPVIKSVLIFENKGEAVGVSNPHPHCQIYAADFHFKLVDEQIARANAYRLKFNRNLFDEIISQEVRDSIRIIAENDSAIAFIPFFARYAYEVMIFPKSTHLTLLSLSPSELKGLVGVFHEVIRKLDMNFEIDFPYVMSVMQAPVDGKRYDAFRMHLWLQPPYRQPGLIKYLAGPEIGAGNFMADTLPEEKAAELRQLNAANYP
jgi:UDPglucose--hexose-1-phosphate uridylyltransferase